MNDDRLAPRVTDLTELEQRLVEAARRGEDVVLDHIDHSALATTVDPDRCVRSEVVRDLLLGRHGALDPRGIRLARARLVGDLDLDNVTSATSLVLRACVLPSIVSCYDAHLRDLRLPSCQLTALHADSLRTDRGMSLEKAKLSGGGEEGVVRLVGAHIGGQLDLRDAEVTNTGTGPALDADSLRTDRGMSLEKAKLSGGGEEGVVRLLGAHIGGQLDLEDAEVTNTGTGPALDADNLRTDSTTFLKKAKLSGGGEEGVVRLLGAHIGGQLDLEDAEVINTGTGPALTADSLRTDSGMFLKKARLSGGGEEGVVRLVGAHIGGQLDLEDAEVINTGTGPALTADSLRTDSITFLKKARLSGAGEEGVVRLSGAHIGDQLDLEDAEVINTGTGPALTADSLRTDSGMFLKKARLSGGGEEGVVRLLGAHIGDQLDLRGLDIEGEDTLVAGLENAEVANAVFLPPDLVCPSASEETGTACAHNRRRIDMDGLVYAGLALVTWRQWLHVLVHHTTVYAPQPFQQLAAVERSAGHDSNARHILITQQDTLRRRDPVALGGPLARGRHGLWGWLGRYGYRAHRLVTALFLTLIAAGALGWIAGQVPTRPGHHAAERPIPIMSSTSTSAPGPGTSCSTAELIGLGIDRGLPLGVTGLRARCDLDTATSEGQAFTYAIWALQALIWALATLTIAAYTGLVRKPS